tara:strand:+ start:7991 stop:9274 length:1284 start_codon:yes stop_codon:yes gene_type:complete
VQTFKPTFLKLQIFQTMPEKETHSRLAPSSAKQWIGCTASIKFCQDNADRIPEDDESSFAQEGTIAHQWCSDILDGLCDISEVPEDMAPHVAAYVELAERLKTDKDSQFVEAKVPLFYKPEDTGTVDYALLSDERVYVLDLKYGQGVIVEAQGNPQLAIYAMSLIKDYETLYDFTDETLVTMTIFQPRTRESSPMKIWSTTLGQLKEFCADITESAEIIKTADTDHLAFAPSADACQWCSGKGICKARRDQHKDSLAKEAIDTLTDLEADGDNKLPDGQMILMPDFEALSELQVATIVQHAPEIKKWLNSVESEAHKALEEGIPNPHLKLVQGKMGNRAWKDEEEADTLIKGKLKADQRFTKKLITLPQAEKLLKPMELTTRFKNRFKELTFRAPAKPILALADDPREAIKVSAEEVLTDLEADDMM